MFHQHVRLDIVSSYIVFCLNYYSSQSQQLETVSSFNANDVNTCKNGENIGPGASDQRMTSKDTWTIPLASQPLKLDCNQHTISASLPPVTSSSEIVGPNGKHYRNLSFSR